MRDIKARLLVMLTERKIKHHLVEGDPSKKVPWLIQYKFDEGDGLGSWKTIMPSSLICDQNWMLEPVIVKIDENALSFDEWLRAVDKLFLANLGMGSEAFEDYNWRDEYESEVTPEDAYLEWTKYNEDGFGR